MVDDANKNLDNEMSEHLLCICPWFPNLFFLLSDPFFVAMRVQQKVHKDILF